MGFDETMVNGADNEAVEEVLPDEIVEDSEDEGPEESLESLTDEGQAAEEQESPKGKQGTSEPGYVAGRIAKAVEKAVAETEARLSAQYEAQFAPLRDRLLEMDAKELVKSGEFKSIDRAKEYLQLKQGIAPTVTDKPAEQPRNANGQFAAKKEQSEADIRVETTVSMLNKQAAKIKANGGPDVIAAFRSNEEISNKVRSGEWDMYDVADYLNKTQSKRPPAPMRSPNGVNGQIKGTIMSMSDKQFEQLEKRVREGARFRE